MNRVAVISDGLISRDEYHNYLVSEGLEPEWFDSERELLPEVHDEDYAVVVIASPGERKVEAGWVLKNHDETGDIPLLMVVEEGNDEGVMKCLQAGADEVIVAPFGKHEFVLRLQAQIEKYTYLTELKERNREIELINRRMKQDLEAAQRAQQALLPPEEQTLGNSITVTTLFRACESLAGDFFDYSHRPEENLLYGLLTDVTGHGPRSALYASQVKSCLHGAALRGESIAELGTTLNATLAKGEESVFATGIVFRADLEAESIGFLSCGHPDFFLQTDEDGSIERLDSSTYPLGVFEEPELPVQERDFGPGGQLLLYSDALVERQSDTGDLFTIDRMEPLVGKLFSGELELNGVYREVHEFGGGADFEDDVSALHLKHCGGQPR